MPNNWNMGGLINSMDVPVIPKIQKINQNWKLLLIPHLFFSFLNICLQKSIIEQKEKVNVLTMFKKLISKLKKAVYINNFLFFCQAQK